MFGLQDDVTKTKTPVLMYQSDSVPVIKIASGNDHLVLLTQRGEVLTLGNAEQGQLGRVAPSFSTRGGRRGRKYLLEPKVITELKRKKLTIHFYRQYISQLKEDSGCQ